MVWFNWWLVGKNDFGEEDNESWLMINCDSLAFDWNKVEEEDSQLQKTFSQTKLGTALSLDRSVFIYTS